MNDKWRNACKKLQNEGVKFDCFKHVDREWVKMILNLMGNRYQVIESHSNPYQNRLQTTYRRNK